MEEPVDLACLARGVIGLRCIEVLLLYPPVKSLSLWPPLHYSSRCISSGAGSPLTGENAFSWLASPSWRAVAREKITERAQLLKSLKIFRLSIHKAVHKSLPEI